MKLGMTRWKMEPLLRSAGAARASARQRRSQQRAALP